MPIPLSCTEKVQPFSPSWAEMRMTGGSSDLYLMALLIRFWKSCTNGSSSDEMVGNGSDSIDAPFSWIIACKFQAADLTTALQSTEVRACWPESLTWMY